MHLKKIKNMFGKTWQEPKTDIFLQQKAMHKQYTTYRLLWIIPTYSVLYTTGVSSVTFSRGAPFCWLIHFLKYPSLQCT